MNRYEKRLLEDLKINRSEDVLRRKRKDNIDLRTFSAVRTNTVEWLKISDDECVFELNGGYGELVDLLSARCRKLYVCAVGASSEDIIRMRSRRNRNVEVISKKDDIITFLSGSDVDRLIIHDVPLVFASKNSLIDLVHKAMETHIPYIDIIFDSADSWHYHSGSGVSGTGRIKKKYE